MAEDSNEGVSASSGAGRISEQAHTERQHKHAERVTSGHNEREARKKAATTNSAPTDAAHVGQGTVKPPASTSGLINKIPADHGRGPIIGGPKNPPDFRTASRGPRERVAPVPPGWSSKPSASRARRISTSRPSSNPQLVD